MNSLRLLYCVIFSSLVFPHAQADPPKRALLVAIGNYPAESGWQKISSINDIELIKNALLKQGFRENEISILTDEMATRDGILLAIRTELIDVAAPGGVAYFHYSGHGQQVADDNDDELDGYDEAIVPVNSPMYYQEGVYEGQNLIRDDELGQLFRQIRSKIGPSGIFQAVLDACHSGTGTRGFGIARGTQVKMAPMGYSHRGQLGSSSSFFENDGMDNLAPMVAFFGAAQNQLNFETTDEEGRSVGSLSYSFSKTISSANPTMTYRGLFEKIKLTMSSIAPRQQPQVEGMLDMEVFGGRMVGVPEYFRARQWNDPGSIVIEAGWLHGIHEGSVVGFYPPETRQVQQAVPHARGTVSFAGAVHCAVRLDADVDQETALSSWVFLLERNFGDLNILVKNNLPQSHPVVPFLKKKFEKLPVIIESDRADLYIILVNPASDESSVQLVTKDDIAVRTFPNSLRPEILAEQIAREMTTFARASFIRKMDMQSADLPVTFEVLPVIINRQNRLEEARLSIHDKMDASGTIRFAVGDVVKIKVTNDGYKPAYFTLLDIQPDNQINVLLPQSNETPSEYLVAPGQSIEVNRYFEFGPPYGTEVFKLIATDQPIDLRSISASRGAGMKSNASRFEQLFSQTFFTDEVLSRGGRTVSLGMTAVNVESLTFIIAE